LEVALAEVVWVGLVVRDDDDDDELEPPLPSENVEPISPHLMFEKVTEVPGVCDSIVVGSPAVLLQGPELPLSNQFMYWLGSFQILKIRTIPLPSASPIVVRPPRLAAVPSAELHHAAVMELRPDDVDTAF